MSKKVVILAVAAAMFAAPALAFDIKLGGGVGGGFNHSFSKHDSGSTGGASTTFRGAATAKATNESYGMSEGFAGGDFDGIGTSTGAGSLGNSNFRFAGENTAGSGSMSSATVKSQGNGAALAGAGGSGFGKGTVGVIGGGRCDPDLRSLSPTANYREGQLSGCPFSMASPLLYAAADPRYIAP